MKQAERDALLIRQTEAAEALNRIGADLGAALAAPERRLRNQELVAGHPPLRRLFGGEGGAVALLRTHPPGMWEREVPEGYLRWTTDRENVRWLLVACPCGEHPAMRPGEIADCTCGRWFLHTGRGARVYKPTEEEAAA